MPDVQSQSTNCTGCGSLASVHAHSAASSRSVTTPRCKDPHCSKVCPHCWQHFIPEVIAEHKDKDAGWGYGCAKGPAPDPLAKGRE